MSDQSVPNVSGHTPLPWMLAENDRTLIVTQSLDDDGNCTVVADVLNYDGMAQLKDFSNAALIVTAVNMHADLLAENARLRLVLQDVIDNDLTEYDHHQKRRDGKKPSQAEEPGSIWLTPREMARAALAESRTLK